jgi:hypothetical protein
MPYTVDNFDNTTSITVNDGAINTDTHVQLIGKNYYGYGTEIAENFIYLMENFASAVAPATNKSVAGQMYYNTTQDRFYRFDGTAWGSFDGSSTRIVTVLDISDGAHTVTVMYDDTTAVSVVSSETFTVKAGETLVAEFPTINKGITLNNGEDYKFHGTATTAQYADLAELYKSDASYEPGTVIKIGGEAEVTQTTELFCANVFGIVSTDPAYLMNSMCEGNTVAVALAGRVPCKVIGQVKKGDRILASEEPGVARVPTDYELKDINDWYRIVGRALEDKTTEGIGLVEVVVGAK